jgi:hypothetical protein
MTIQELETKMAAVEAKAKSLSQSKLWYLLLLVPIIILKYRSFLINLLVNNSKQITDDAAKQSATLVQQETQANDQANKIIADADKAKTTADSQDVPNDWFKKQ